MAEIFPPASVPAVVHVNDAMNNFEVIKDYYSFCKVEYIGPYRGMRIDRLSFFRNFVELTERLLFFAPFSSYHVIVTHGTPDKGLLIRFSKNSTSNATGPMISDLIKIVKKVEAGKLSKSLDRFQDPDLDQIKALTRTTDNADALNIAENLAKIRKRQLVISVRGCNIGKNMILMNSYKEAFNAPRLLAPESRNLFVRIKPDPGTKMTEPQLQRLKLTKHPRYQTDKTLASLPVKSIRRRFFAGEKNDKLQPIVIDVIDHDGHENVEAMVYILNLGDAVGWARTLNGAWTRQNESQFVLQVMWENTEDSWHYPRELSFTKKIRVA